MPKTSAAALFIALLALGAAPATFGQTIDLETARLVDLSHAYNAKTLYWPTSPSAFELEELSRGKTPGGWFYSAYRFSTPEHGGTHIDAPVHFFEAGHSNERIPLRTLMGRAAVIDISAKAAGDADYRLSAADIRADEKQNGRIADGSIVLLRTGWSARWPDRLAYLGDDTPGDASNLHFPGFGAEAVRFLIGERKVAMIGIDTASIDFGQSKDFIVHQLVSTRNIPGLENLTGLEKLPARGAALIALPIKIEGGSGGPVRVVAILPPDNPSD